MRLPLYIGIGLILFGSSCGGFREGRAVSLSAGEYYDLGRYARLDEDWEGAVGYFEKALSAAEVAGNDYYRGYACQQLSALWAMACEYGAALDYARSSVVALEACGETAGACLSRLEMAWHHLSLGDYASAQALLPPLRAAFSSPDSPAAPRLAQLESALLDASAPLESALIDAPAPLESALLDASTSGSVAGSAGVASSGTPSSVAHSSCSASASGSGSSSSGAAYHYDKTLTKKD